MAWHPSPVDARTPGLLATLPPLPAERVRTSPALWHGARVEEWRRFALLAVLAVLATAGFILWTKFRIGGDRATIAVDDIGEGVASAAAAISCALAARQSRGRVRLAWGLIAASAASWTIGEIIWSVYEVGLGVAVPFPSAADAGYLLAIPLAIAGVLAFAYAPSRFTTRGEAVLAGAIVAMSLLYVGWASGLGAVYSSSPASPAALLIGLAYPVADIITITVLVIVLRRAPRSQVGRMLLLIAGLAANSLADSTFAYLTANGTYGAIGSVLDSGWVAGYLLIALAPWWPSPAADEPSREGPIELWQLALPWIAVLAAALTAIYLAATDQNMGRFLTVLAGGIGVLFVCHQILSHRDSLDLLKLSHRAEAQLRDRTALLNQVIVQSPLGIARVGIDLKIVDANPRLGSLLRAKPTEMIGAPVSKFLTAAEMERTVQTFQPLWNGSVDTIESDTPALRTDGTTVWLHWSATAVKRPGGRNDFFLAMFEDATTEHTAQEAAAANLAALERLNRLKSEFVSLVSHEFRTALVGIQGFSEMIRDQDLTVDEVKTFAGDINKDAERLNRMITDMLDLDRIEAGRMTLHIGAIDLNLTIRDAVERARAASPEHLITTNLEPDLPAVSGDSDRLFQVVSNLLSNAIKYSPKGSEILISTRAEDSRVQVSVRDRGQGIAPEFVKRLFGRYERYEGKTKGGVIGTGLGLAITRQIVEMHGGRIWVESKVGEGSDFIFAIPVVAAPSLASKV